MELPIKLKYSICIVRPYYKRIRCRRENCYFPIQPMPFIVRSIEIHFTVDEKKTEISKIENEIPIPIYPEMSR